MKIIDYQSERKNLLNGMLYFTALKLDPLSTPIRLGCRSMVSHVGAIVSAHIGGELRWMAIEADKHGVSAHFLSDVVYRYRKGHVWFVAPKACLSGLDYGRKFASCILSMEPKKYDWLGAGKSWLPWKAEQDLTSVFCSELISFSMDCADGYDGWKINHSMVTPADLLRWDLWTDVTEVTTKKCYTRRGIELPEIGILRMPYAYRGRWFWKKKISLEV